MRPGPQHRGPGRKGKIVEALKARRAGVEPGYAIPHWFAQISAARYLGVAPWDLARQPTWWTEWSQAHEEIMKDLREATSGKGGRAGSDNRPAGDGGFSARREAALERRAKKGGG